MTAVPCGTSSTSSLADIVWLLGNKSRPLPGKVAEAAM